jgi:uncharacterized protein (DUF736 family)
VTQYDNTNRGVLFKNDDKQSDNHPDYKGQINVNGVDLWLSAWIKTPKAGGQKFMSLSVKPKEQPRSKPAPPAEQMEAAPFDDEIHF